MAYMKKKALRFNDAVQRRTETFKASAAHGAQAVGDAVKDVHDKAEGVADGVKEGLHDIKKDIHHAAGTISKEFGSR